MLDITQKVEHFGDGFYKGLDYLYDPEAYDLELTQEIGFEVNRCKFYYTELDVNRRSEWKAPRVSFEQAIPYLYAYAAVDTAVNAFETLVWYPYLQKLIQDCPNRGMSVQIGPTKMLTYSMAGRCMLTLSNEKGSWISLVTADDEKPYNRVEVIKREKMGPMGYNGPCATANEIMKMISDVIGARENLELKPDDGVGIG